MLLGVAPVWLVSSTSVAAGPPETPAEARAERPEWRSEVVERFAAHSVEIVDLTILGREQVAERQIVEALEAEGLVAGTLVVWPDDPRVERARSALVATGYFWRVTLRLDPVDGSRDRARLVVELEERGSLEITNVYAASSRLTPFHGGVELVERNFLGRSVHLGGGVIWGTHPQGVPRARRQQGYRIFAEIPRIASSRVGVRAAADVRSASEPYRVAGDADDPDPELFRTVDYTRIGGELGLTFPIAVDWQLGASYRFERVEADVPDSSVWVRPDGLQRPSDLGLRDGSHRRTSLDFSVAWDGREQLATLGQGGRVGLEVSVSSPAVGSSYEWVEVLLGAGWGFRLPWTHVLTPSLLAGQIVGDAPRFELFYPGDLSDWTPGREMGLVYSTRNPIDVFGTAIDRHGLAHHFGRIDLEYAIPLFRRARTQLVDGGHFFFSFGTFLVAGDPATRRERREDGLPVAPVGLNGNLGLRLETSLGRVDISVGNALRRVPL
jgi:hypothetical protein